MANETPFFALSYTRLKRYQLLKNRQVFWHITNSYK